MIPLVLEILPDLTNKHIFMSSGLYDPVVPKQEAERLFGLFKKKQEPRYHCTGKIVAMN
jgi:predicted esterase